MYKNLYDKFSNWFHGGQVWFYSDPHFGDQEMFEIRKVTDTEQIKSINSKLGKNDTLVILGDIGDKEGLKKLRGYKILILGNHDPGATTFKDYADEIYEGMLMINDKLILSHEPLVNFPYAVNIHGHNHAAPALGNIYLEHHSDINALHINVCAEHINYTPVCLKTIVNSGILKNAVNIHRETIDKAK